MRPAGTSLTTNKWTTEKAGQVLTGMQDFAVTFALGYGPQRKAARIGAREVNPIGVKAPMTKLFSRFAKDESGVTAIEYGLIATLIGVAIIVEASLSFVGLGVQPPAPSWGTMLADARSYIFSGQWWIALFPGLAICLTVVGFNLLGDALRDLLDPRGSARAAFI